MIEECAAKCLLLDESFVWQRFFPRWRPENGDAVPVILQPWLRHCRIMSSGVSIGDLSILEISVV